MKNDNNLTIKNLQVRADGKRIIKGVTIRINPGEMHVVMGPNGSGKSTMAQALMGHPNFEVKKSESEVMMNGRDLLSMSPDERAKNGLFLAFQHPTTVSGISVQKFLWRAYKSLYPETKMRILDFQKQMGLVAKNLGISKELLKRSLNEDFSGGEKKRIEIFQMLMLEPKYVILDEVDSGLDVDAIKIVAKGVKQAIKELGVGVVLITHYQRILEYLKPDFVHILIDGKIVKSGGMEIVGKIEKNGYKQKFNI
jgi:Fe-S cluster assembly ATP-binding protein